jgi:hypothetical protein
MPRRFGKESDKAMTKPGYQHSAQAIHNMTAAQPRRRAEELKSRKKNRFKKNETDFSMRTKFARHVRRRLTKYSNKQH